MYTTMASMTGSSATASVPQRHAIAPEPTVEHITTRIINTMSMSNVMNPESTTAEPQPDAVPPQPKSMTSKEWVIPPRPKPGRKPATDAPSTKRKAQNRAAQRAFRERRAARVGELEEQLDKHRVDREKLEQDLRARVQDIEMQLQALQARNVILESMLKKERTARSKAEAELEVLRGRLQSTNNNNMPQLSMLSTCLTGTSSIPSKYSPSHSLTLLNRGLAMPVISSTSPLSLPHVVSTPAVSPVPLPTPGSMSVPVSLSVPELSVSQVGTCDFCVPEGRCSCAEQIIESISARASDSGNFAGNVGECGRCLGNAECECAQKILSVVPSPAAGSLSPAQPTLPDLKRTQRAGTPPLLPKQKRLRSTSESMRLKPSVSAKPASAIAPEPCGFCDDANFCVCTEAAATVIAEQTTVQKPRPMMSHESNVGVNFGVESKSPVLSCESELALTPMEVTSTGAIKLPAYSSLPKKNQSIKPSLTTISAPSEPGSLSCRNKEPGTCVQCLSNPRSGLFCRSLAAIMTQNTAAGTAGCCSGSSGKSGCGKGSTTDTMQAACLSLSCADAYKTLQTHKNFDRATEHIDSWLPKLKPRPPKRKPGTADTTELKPLEVEAASIMSVLKEFDVRFGK